MVIEIDVVDPRDAEVRRVLEAHLDFARRVTPEGHVHALDGEGLLDRSVTLYGARIDGEMVATGALKHLDDDLCELKSMHTLVQARGRGVGRNMLHHLLGVAAAKGYVRVNLETGTDDSFEPARALYSSAGFVECEPFGQYWRNPYSVCMTMTITPARDGSSA